MKKEKQKSRQNIPKTSLVNFDSNPISLGIDAISLFSDFKNNDTGRAWERMFEK